jgi:hypothetical protein
MNSFKRSLLGLMMLLALMLPGCEYGSLVVDGFKNGVEDFVTITTIAALEAILPIGELVGADRQG